jgi:hypothetical protein
MVVMFADLAGYTALTDVHGDAMKAARRFAGATSSGTRSTSLPESQAKLTRDRSLSPRRCSSKRTAE